MRALGLAATIVALAAAAFWGAVVTDRTEIAAGVAIAVPTIGIAILWGPWRDYVGRHVGLGAASHLLVLMWGLAMIAVLGDSTAVGVRAMAVACGAAGLATVVDLVASARFPAELAWHDADGHVLIGRGGQAGVRPGLTVVFAAAVLAGALVAVWGAGDGTIAVLGVTTVIYAAVATWVMVRTARLIVSGDSAHRGAIARALESHAARFVMHFSGSIQTIYQLDQWMDLLERAGRCVLVVREMPVFERVKGRYGVPVAYVREFADLDLVVASGARVACYVNTATKNNHLVRFSEVVHVQLHHGDSDKPVSSSKVMRLYDRHVVAGPAAVERLAGAGIEPADVLMTGRPQTMAIAPGPTGNDVPTVVYAPTWEGSHADTKVSSVVSMGTAIVDAVPDGWRVVVRPHPLTGTHDRSARGALGRLKAAVDGRGGRWVDPGTEPLQATLGSADVLVTDVSSVLVDFLVADRPAIVTDPAGVGEDEVHRRFPSTSWAEVLTDPAQLPIVIERALGGDGGASRRAAARTRLLGDVSDPVATFLTTLRDLVDSASSNGG